MKSRLRLGPARFYRPVCIRWPWGFSGGPAAYVEVEADQAGAGPIIVEVRTDPAGERAGAPRAET